MPSEESMQQALKVWQTYDGGQLVASFAAAIDEAKADRREIISQVRAFLMALDSGYFWNISEAKNSAFTEPWASLYVHGLKRIETRGWSDSHHGWTAIYATKGGLSKADFAATITHPEFAEALRDVRTFHPGHIIGVVNIVACHLLNKGYWQPGIFEIFPDLDTQRERAFGDYSKGRYGFLAAENFVLLKPIPFTSRQGKFLDLPEEIANQIRQQYKTVNHG